MELVFHFQLGEATMALKSEYQFANAAVVPVHDLVKASEVEVTLTHSDGSVVTLQGSMDYGPSLDWTSEELVNGLPAMDSPEDWQRLVDAGRVVRLSHLRIDEAWQQLPSSVEAYVPLKAISSVLTKWNV